MERVQVDLWGQERARQARVAHIIAATSRADATVRAASAAKQDPDVRERYEREATGWTPARPVHIARVIAEANDDAPVATIRVLPSPLALPATTPTEAALEAEIARLGRLLAAEPRRAGRARYLHQIGVLSAQLGAEYERRLPVGARA